jgi:hypothetical protein
MTAISTTHAWLRRTLAVFVLLAFMPLATTACFGKFQLTRNLYKFNKEVSPDKWIQWFVMLVLGIIPIYGLATLIDLVIANSIEFWTDENPIKPSADAGTTKVVRGPAGEVLTMTHLPDDRIEVTITRTDDTTDRFFLSREAGSVAAYDAQGALMARVGEGSLQASAAR